MPTDQERIRNLKLQLRYRQEHLARAKDETEADQIRREIEIIQERLRRLEDTRA